jgi:integrase
MPSKAAATEKNYRIAGNNYFLPEWGNVPLGNLDRGTIQRFLNGLIDKGIAKTRINVLRALLSGFFSYAIVAGLVFYNPVKTTSKVKENPRPVKTISPDQASLLLKCAGSRYKTHMSVLYLCGLRIAELRGLTWNDFSTTGKWLRVEKTIYENGEAMIADTGQPFSLTKSKRGERLIPLSPLAVKILNHWKRSGWHRQVDNKFDLIFPSIRGNPLHQASLRKAITEAADAARKQWTGREPFPAKVFPHLLRSGFARMMLTAGVRLPELMVLMGHSHIDQTRIYAEWEVGKDTLAADLQSKLLGRDFGSISSRA